jgi:predicted Zn finger-like uncharacterized protein
MLSSFLRQYHLFLRRYLMILTCPQCQAQYKLDPGMLGTTGREVRCVSCSHMWFQIPETAVAGESRRSAETPAAAHAPEPSVTEALNTILQQDDAAFEAVLSTVAHKEAETKAPVIEAVEPRPRPVKKAVVKQEKVIVHNPLGLGAEAFGGLVFLLCCFLTLGVLFIGKTPITRHWPQMSLLYKTIGIKVLAPGEGLRLSEVTAERRIDENNAKTLVIEGKLTNVAEHEIAYPTLHVVMKNSINAVAKTWDVKPGVTRIASGDVVPVMLQLNDLPEDGAMVDVSVKEEK